MRNIIFKNIIDNMVAVKLPNFNTAMIIAQGETIPASITALIDRGVK